MTRQNKRRPLVLIGGGLAAFGGVGSGGWFLLGGRGAGVLSHVALPADIAVWAACVTIAVSAIAALILMLDRLVRTLQRLQAGKKLLKETSGHKEALETFREMTRGSSQSRVDQDDGDDDDDQASKDGQGTESPDALTGPPGDGTGR
jgi:hypothetical protein